MTQIEDLRRKGVQATAGVCVASALILLAVSLWQGRVVFGFVGLVLAVLPGLFALSGRHDTAARTIVAGTLPIYAALILATVRETSWSLDMHMIFFAFLAVTAIMADWRPILAATAVTALHHLVLNFAAPAYVFPDGASLARVALHAAIVLMETGVLIILCLRIEDFVAGLSEARAQRADQEAKVAAEREAAGVEQRTALEKLKENLEHLSRGDLTVAVQNLPEAYREFETNFNISVRSLDKAIGEVVEGVRAMSSGTAEISSASNDPSRRTQEQAGNLEETAAAIGQTTQGVGETARAAQAARATVASTNGEAQDGGQIVGEAVLAMERIEKSSEEITNIISVIDSIAFQTNLLALNAGVEAARAGETGKGFAVVASEVRALAQRCAEAAEEVKTLVNASNQHVLSGADLVKRSGKSFATITKGISELAQSLDAIAAGSEAQAETLTQISDAVRSLDHSTQQNSAMAEECTATAVSLAGEAESLARSISGFRTSESKNEFGLSAYQHTAKAA
ncbi:MAG: methyl-accepting chemotaxis protein [Erythrobacter sp.]|uniref:methyl-accepting chemotaxis protein n=1 Tax=Erythrobacter sp. TaxID=1042 RepID=UPI002625FBD6|nr:methyl-accepting chemotaxis protein [Erythrobacter sp.]MDJ0977112.1 methyl-accepting chemotaxis protein [Erythrobacter sp.]